MKREYDLAVEDLLQLVGCTSGRKWANKDPPSLIVLGDGDFGRDGTSIHKKFARFLVKKCQALGIDCRLVAEDFTSKTCPRCFQYAHMCTMRQTYCWDCDMPFHRDLMAAHNMAIIAEEVMYGQGRPKPFQQPFISD